MQDVESPRIVLYPEPTSAKASKLAEGSPGTTRITSKSGVLAHQKDVRTSARLTGDVVVAQFDPARGDLRLRTQIARLHDGVARRRGAPDAQTADAREHRRRTRAHRGHGLDADLAAHECRVTILRRREGPLRRGARRAHCDGRRDRREAAAHRRDVLRRVRARLGRHEGAAASTAVEGARSTRRPRRAGRRTRSTATCSRSSSRRANRAEGTDPAEPSSPRATST